MKSNTALSQFVDIALYCRCSGSVFDSLVTGDILVHNKFSGIHIMDFHPLAGLASYALPLETSLKSSAAEGRKKKIFLNNESYLKLRRKGGRNEGKKEKEMRNRGNQESKGSQEMERRHDEVRKIK